MAKPKKPKKTAKRPAKRRAKKSASRASCAPKTLLGRVRPKRKGFMAYVAKSGHVYEFDASKTRRGAKGKKAKALCKAKPSKTRGYASELDRQIAMLQRQRAKRK